MTKIVKLPKKPAAEAPVAPAAPVADRPTYSGGLAADELLRPGGKLLAMLVARANQLGMKMNDMCQQELGCTYGYLHQLRTGVRQASNISDEFATRCALFLGVPRLTVLMASGRVAVEDYFDRQKMVAGEIRRAMQFVMDDPTYGVDMHPEVLDLQLSTQFAIIGLYEKATNRKLLDSALTMESLVQQLTQLDEAIAKLKTEVGAKDVATETAPSGTPA